MMYEIKLDGQWVDVPEWARWVAQDKNGLWFFYGFKPFLRPYWRGQIGSWDALEFGRLARVGKPRKNWKEQVYRIVRKCPQ